MKLAGGPGDRWLGHRKMAGREESPDTVLRHALHFVRSGTLDRATRLVTPGGACGRRGESPAATCVTESATENIPPAERSTVASRRETCETSSKRTHRLARVKRWGKSPPPRWQHRGHGKPRVVQGQIGGESRPGSMSQRFRSRPFCGRSCNERTPFSAAQAALKDRPSGRLLESRREAWPRGMIAAFCNPFCGLQNAQNPAYRPVRQFLTFPASCRMMLSCGCYWSKMIPASRAL
jgi:hypothetical protein